MTVENLEYLDRALALLEKARDQGIEFRILGSLAYRLHCPANLILFDEMQRDITDVDLAANGKQRREARAFLEAEGYEIDRDLLVASEGSRYAFSDPGSGMVVDIFFDELFFCHPIPLRDRLALDYPTITPTDLLLEKMQIVELNPKDVKDSLVLLLEHPLHSSKTDAIDADYISRLLAADWGFYYTVSMNLERLKRELAAWRLDDGQRQVIAGRIDELAARIEKEPKTSKWKVRARIGTRKRWYQEVAEKSRTY